MYKKGLQGYCCEKGSFHHKKNETFIFWAKRYRNDKKFDIETLGGALRPNVCSSLGNKVSSTTVIKGLCFAIRIVKLGQQ